MNILYIDGEYLKKIMPLNETLENIINKFFGILYYPDKIIYYTANISNEKRKTLEKIKNLEINDKGYIHKKSDNTIEQKGVDGYIVSDMTDASWDDEIKNIILIAGDGDLKAGLEKIIERKNKKVKLIALPGTISRELSYFSELYHFDSPINGSKDEGDVLKDFRIFKKMYPDLKSKFGSVTDCLIGKYSKDYNFDYKIYGQLKNFMKILKDKNLISLTKVPGTPHYEITLSSEKIILNYPKGRERSLPLF
jgi:uncharacterized LabA/DUF88 family protein